MIVMGSKMLIRVGYEFLFDVPSPVPILLKLYLHPSQLEKVKKREELRIEPETAVEEFVDDFGNRVGRLVLPAGRVRLWNSAVVSNNSQPDIVNCTAQEIPVESLPVKVLPYLLGSRYCEVDRLCDMAWKIFDQTPRGWGRVQAVCDWVHDQSEFRIRPFRVQKCG